jgi:23S rRNA pseudouridine1911/1915/1917 synthase
MEREEPGTGTAGGGARAAGARAEGGPPAGQRALTVPPDLAGTRIDRALAVLLPELSRTEAHRLIERGLVRLGGTPVARASQRLKAGDEIEVEWAPPLPAGLEPEAIPLDVRYEDEHLAVIAKPAGLVMHPGAGARRGTLAAGLLARYGALPGAAGRPGLVHRLDRDTSGLVVVARSPLCLRRLQAAVAAREVERTYEALVWGAPHPAAGVVDLPLARSRSDRTRMAAVRRGGARTVGRIRPATTEYRVVEPLGLASRLEVRLLTGRTHQIRVHLASIGHPVIGDPTYGGRPASLVAIPAAERERAKRVLEAIDRQALHAFRLAFRHPMTGEEMRFVEPRPADLEACLAILREGRPAWMERS